jgi:hypothetical protein
MIPNTAFVDYRKIDNDLDTFCNVKVGIDTLSQAVNNSRSRYESDYIQIESNGRSIDWIAEAVYQ